MRALLGMLLLAGLFAGGCHVGFAGIYGFNGPQKVGGMTVSCPRCGNSEIARMRVTLPEPVIGTALENTCLRDWYCPQCRTWWRTQGWNHYVRGPGWPWTDSR